jgi:dolichol-phosphate mannosyltransferase
MVKPYMSTGSLKPDMTPDHGVVTDPHAARPIIVIPTYCECVNITNIIPAILASGPYEVLVVDDGSPDGTGDAVSDLSRMYPGRVHLIRRAGKLGLGTAYITGFRWALQRDYTHILEMDADFSHHPAALARLLQASRHADLVIGSRYVPGGRTVNWSPLRKIISRGGSIYARTLLGLPIQDLTSGFKCFRRHVLEWINLDSVTSTGYAFQIELAYRAASVGYRIVEVPITFSERSSGESKMSATIFLEGMTRVLQLRFSGAGLRTSRRRRRAPIGVSQARPGQSTG